MRRAAGLSTTSSFFSSVSSTPSAMDSTMRSMRWREASSEARSDWMASAVWLASVSSSAPSSSEKAWACWEKRESRPTGRPPAVSATVSWLAQVAGATASGDVVPVTWVMTRSSGSTSPERALQALSMDSLTPSRDCSPTLSPWQRSRSVAVRSHPSAMSAAPQS